MTLDITPEERRNLKEAMRHIENGGELSDEERATLNQYYNADYYAWILEKEADGKELTDFESLYESTFSELDGDVSIFGELDPGMVKVREPRNRRHARAVVIQVPTTGSQSHDGRSDISWGVVVATVVIAAIVMLVILFAVGV